jgi:hypothetical protein
MQSCIALKGQHRACADLLVLPMFPHAQARKAAGIVARSKVEILAAEQDMYVSRTTGEAVAIGATGLWPF